MRDNDFESASGFMRVNLQKESMQLKLTVKQKEEALRSVLGGNDSFVFLSTGYGVWTRMPSLVVSLPMASQKYSHPSPYRQGLIHLRRTTLV